MMKRLTLLIAATMLVAGCATNKSFNNNANELKADNAGGTFRFPASGRDVNKCLRQIVADGCYIDAWDVANIAVNVTDCTITQSEGGKTRLAAFLTKHGKIAVVKSIGQGVKENFWGNSCPVYRFNTGEGGASAIANDSNKLWFATANGHIYWMDAGNNFYELLKGDGKEYKGVVDIYGNDEGKKDVVLKFDNGQTFQVTDKVLKARREGKNVVKVTPEGMERFMTDRDGYRSPFTR